MIIAQSNAVPLAGAKPGISRGAQTKFQNIDLIRLLAAAIVVWFHIGRSFPAGTFHDFGIDKHHYFFTSFLRIVFNGPASVMLFFVISGLCINLPYRNNGPINVAEFYVRRYVRIWPPLLAAVVLSGIATGHYDFSGLPIVWSLWCEAFYYLLYPPLVLLISRFGFKSVFGASCLAAILLSVTESSKQTWGYGPFLTWIIFLPVWLSGIWISENTQFASRFKRILSTKNCAAAGALGLFILSFAVTMFRFHTHGSGRSGLYAMWLFSAACAVFVFILLDVDLSENKWVTFLERQGRCSYSLYLVHYPVINITTKVMFSIFGIVTFSQKLLVVSSFAVFGLAYLTATVFYWLVEKPSHELAKHFGVKVRTLSTLVIRRQDSSVESQLTLQLSENAGSEVEVKS